MTGLAIAALLALAGLCAVHHARWHAPGIAHGHWWATRRRWAHLAVPLAALAAGAGAVAAFHWWPVPVTVTLWAGAVAIALAMVARPPRRAGGR